MSKIIIFLKDGKTTKADITKKVELSVAGHSVIFSNGSFKSGFQDTCDAIIMSCKNDTIVKWAKENFIDVSYIGEENKVEVEPEQPLVVNEDENKVKVDEEVPVIDVSSESLESESVEAALLALDEAQDKKEEEVIPPSLPSGFYVDPEGVEYEHKGRAYRKEFKVALQKFGVSNVKMKSE